MLTQLPQDALTISLSDLKSYAIGETENKVYQIWQEILERLPEKAREELREKGFQLVDDPATANDFKHRYLLLKPKEATGQYQELISKIVPQIVCSQ